MNAYDYLNRWQAEISLSLQFRARFRTRETDVCFSMELELRCEGYIGIQYMDRYESLVTPK